MDTLKKTVTQIGTPVSKLKVEFVSNHTVKSTSTAQTHSNSSDPSKAGPGASTVEEEEALLEKEPPQILKNECVTNDGACEDVETDLQKMCDDNVKRKSDTPRLGNSHLRFF
ncbi:hypothetical protein Rs2_51999 [Raphanus sativus]|nr:hypothetical protein Rs2_51999 [Raphanus sativus]